MIFLTYAIKLNKKNKPDDENVKSEIWALITNINTNEKIEKKVWWEDKKGVIHDCTPEIPVELRRAIDNALIENRNRL